MKTFGLIGKSLKHSFSKDFFTQKFAEENIDARYLNFEMEDVTEVKRFLEDDKTIVGFNVTIPYKQSILEVLDDVDQTAATIGAVNTISVLRNERNVRLKGYNTDWKGFEGSIPADRWKNIQYAVVLGTGGASLAVFHVLKIRGCVITQVSRYPKGPQIGYEQLGFELLQKADLIVNCTPLGMYPHVNSCPQIAYHAINKTALAFDLVYNPENSLFLQNCAKEGLAVMNGKNMLEKQASAAWDIWLENHKD